MVNRITVDFTAVGGQIGYPYFTENFTIFFYSVSLGIGEQHVCVLFIVYILTWYTFWISSPMMVI